jgi:hypothetical protein
MYYMTMITLRFDCFPKWSHYAVLVIQCSVDHRFVDATSNQCLSNCLGSP